MAACPVGPLGGSPQVAGGGQTGSNLLTSGWTGAVAPRLNRGDGFTINRVFSVNPQNRQSTGRLQMFVATANVASDGGGLATIPIYPALTPPNLDGSRTQFQTVNVSPLHGDTLTR